MCVFECEDCVCLSSWVCGWESGNLCMCVCVCVRLFICLYVWGNSACMYVFRVCVEIDHDEWVRVCAPLHTLTDILRYVSPCVCVCLFMYVCVHVYIYIYVCVCVCVCV